MDVPFTDEPSLGVRTPRPPPGPTSYTVTYGNIGTDKSKGHKLLGRNFAPLGHSGGPGPNIYSPRLANVSHTPTLKGKFVQLGAAAEEAYPSPGPGEYNIAGTLSKTAPTMKWRTTVYGDDLLSPRKLLVPGPGHYEPKDSLAIKRTTRDIKISPRLHFKEKITPGPGEYSAGVAPSKPTAPSFSLGAKVNSNTILGAFVEASIPGPWAYHIEETSHKVGISFGNKFEPPQDSSAYVPGPQQYSPRHTTEVAHTATLKGKPRPPKPPEDTPGPGAYEATEGLGKGPRITFKGRSAPQPNDDTPGPGKYDINEVQKSPRTPRIAKPLQESHFVGYVSHAKDPFPGPGDYETPNVANHFKDTPKITIKGKAKQKQVFSKVGPGTYDIKTTIGEGPKPTLHSRQHHVDVTMLRTPRDI